MGKFGGLAFRPGCGIMWVLRSGGCDAQGGGGFPAMEVMMGIDLKQKRRIERELQQEFAVSLTEEVIGTVGKTAMQQLAKRAIAITVMDAFAAHPADISGAEFARICVDRLLIRAAAGG